MSERAVDERSLNAVFSSASRRRALNCCVRCTIDFNVFLKGYPMKSFLRSIAIGATLFIGTLPASVGVANAKQCVWNKAGIILKVKWYKPADLARAVKNSHFRPRPVQVDQYPAFQGRCTRGKWQRHKLVAVLSVAGGNFARGFARGFIKAFVGAGGAALCLSSLGTACVATAGAAPAVFELADKIQDGNENFAAVAPPTHRWYDVWNPVWDLKHGPVGGPIR